MTNIFGNSKHSAPASWARILSRLLPAMACALLLVSCFDDDSTGFVNDVSDITVSGIDEEYNRTAYVGEKLEIAPTVETGYSDDQMDYQWMLLDASTGSTNANGDTIQPTIIGTEKNLSYEVNLPPGDYQIRYVARAKVNDYTSITLSKLTVDTEFSSGFYIMKETAGGNTELDLYTSKGNMASDLLEKTQGSALQGKPYSMWMNYGHFYVNTETDQMESTNSVTVITETGEIKMMRSSDLQVIFDRSSLLYDDMEAGERPYAMFLQMMYGLTYFSSNGVRYTNDEYSLAGTDPCTGKFGMPVSGVDGGSKYVTHSIPGFGSMIVWDETNHNLNAVNYNFMQSPLTYMDLSGEDVTQGLANYECLSCGTNIVSGTETDNFILQDNATGRRYVYLCDGSYLDDRIAVPANSNMARATAFATNGRTARYIYSTTGDKLYGYNFANTDFSEVEMPLQGIGQGETISYVANQFVGNSGSSNFDYLIVGTQNGNSYKLYFYNMVGGVPDGAPVKTVSGTGKVKAVRSLTPGVNLSYLMFGYYIYPIND